MTVTDTAIRLTGGASLLAACAVLLLGTWLGNRAALLAKYSIPSPIVGGVLFAFFVDLMNAVVLTGFPGLLGIR